jgi:hypothetical protein
MKQKHVLIMSAAVLFATLSYAQDQQQMKPEETEIWEPVPKMVTPGKNYGDPPSDAIVLFDGKNLNEWVTNDDSTKPAEWTVGDGVFTVNKSKGNIRTKRSFLDYQLHIEWKEPQVLSGKGQGRGNSGLFLASLGKGDAGYELQILDSYNNPTYVNGQAGSIYKQTAPLVNAMLPNGEWQTYDVIWTAPRFNDDGTVKTPAYLTLIHNGVVIQSHTELKGPTQYIGHAAYRQAHGAAPIKLQSHGDPSEPISFKNIWIREITTNSSSNK